MQSGQPNGSSPASTLSADHAAALDLLLGELLEHQRESMAACAAHRAALAGADHHALGACVVRQQQLGQRLAELDVKRSRLVATVTRAVPGAARTGGETRLSDLANRAEEPWRSRLLDRAAELRARMADTTREQASLRLASESLLAHMKGLMAQVHRQLSATGTYARSHTPAESAVVVSGIDLTT